MKSMRKGQWRSVSLVVATIAVTTAVACADWQAPPSAPVIGGRLSDASGNVKSALWMRTKSGMQLISGGTSQMTTSTEFDGTIRTNLSAPVGASRDKSSSASRAFAPTSDDSANALALRNNVSDATFFGRAGKASVVAGVSKTEWKPASATLQFRKVASRVVDGKTMTIAMAPSKTRGEPARAMAVTLNGKMVTLVETDYSHRGNVYKAEMSRTTMFDADGAVSSIADMDMREMVALRDVSSNSESRARDGKLARLIGLVVESIQPDALYAAAPPASPVPFSDCSSLLTMLNNAFDDMYDAYDAALAAQNAWAAIWDTIHACLTPEGLPCIQFSDPTLYATLMGQLATAWDTLQTLGAAYNAAIAWYNTVYAAYVLCLAGDPPHVLDTAEYGQLGECNNWACEFTIWYDYFGNFDHISNGPCWCKGFET